MLGVSDGAKAAVLAAFDALAPGDSLVVVTTIAFLFTLPWVVSFGLKWLGI